MILRFSQLRLPFCQTLSAVRFSKPIRGSSTAISRLYGLSFLRAERGTRMAGSSAHHRDNPCAFHTYVQYVFMKLLNPSFFSLRCIATASARELNLPTLTR